MKIHVRRKVGPKTGHNRIRPGLANLFRCFRVPEAPTDGYGMEAIYEVICRTGVAHGSGQSHRIRPLQVLSRV
jgi:hypothetical protein